MGAVASFHGASLATDGPDSPVLLASKSKASFLIAIAENDDMRTPKEKDVLRETLGAAKLNAEIDTFLELSKARCALLVDRDGPAAVHLRASLGDEGLLDVGSLDAAHADRLAHLHHRDRGVARNLANLGDVHDPAHPRARRRGSASTPMARGTGGVVDPEGSRDGGARGARRGKTRPDAGDVHGRRHVAFVRLCE